MMYLCCYLCGVLPRREMSLSFVVISVSSHRYQCEYTFRCANIDAASAIEPCT